MNLVISLTLLLCAATEPLKVDAFADGAKHYRDGSGKEEYPRLAETEVAAIADNILLLQRDNGGWPSNWDPQRKLNDEETATIRETKAKLDTTFDNRATYTEIDYLAGAFKTTGDARYRGAALRGLEFMLAAQHACGGFPHSWPDTNNYRPYITFMDDVTAGALTTLRKVALGAPEYGFVDDALRARIAETVARGTACVLQLQQTWQGEPAVWAGQYDNKTLQPTAARKFEQPGFVSAESAGVVRYLMAIDNPSPEIVRAIEGAVKWFELAAIHGHRLEAFSIPPVRFDNHTARRDVRLVEDPAAPPLWGRFHEFDTLRPYMANRDGVKVYKLEDVALERRSGYSWYGVYAKDLLEKEYPAWKARCTVIPAEAGIH